MSKHTLPAGQWVEPSSGNILQHHELMARLAGFDAVLLGERHDRRLNHLWQVYVAAGLYAHRSNMMMGFEMFPKRLNPVLQRWVAGELTPELFFQQAEWGTVWGFPADLYQPLFDFCRLFQVPMLGLNCRRELVSEVGEKGWEGVLDANKEGLSQACPATMEYRQYLFDVTGGGRTNRAAQSPGDPNFDRFVRAQQTWDRAFACRIAEAVNSKDKPLVVGIIGRGHLEGFHGTPAQLADLGVRKVAVLLPWDGSLAADSLPGSVATAVFTMMSGE
ncbi:MAG: ChaN family lipoprotein [Halomonas sp.]|uniref:ChaN family lipoprotein n=1 Tax=Halomonas sp. TaxID=1486246 RepID=UPI003F916B37